MTEVDESKLRSALRPVFDKFDEDGSGHISSHELRKMVTELKMEISKEDLRKMLTEADPDKSGEIDFDEFCVAVKHQIEMGHGGGLAAIVEKAGGFFGMFGGLFSMFGGGEAAATPPAAPSPPAAAASPTAMVPKSPKVGGASSPPRSPSPERPPLSPTGAGSPSASPTGASPPGGTFDPDLNPTGQRESLFDRFMSPSDAHANKKLGHGETRTTRLRATGVKLSCYLNMEVDRGRATVISLPEDCDTLGEVLPKIQQQMQLDKRMCYAAELYLPDGKKITSYKALIDAAALDTAIIVGCGEPFDTSTIPYDHLEFHLQGGGRAAAKKVKRQLQDKRFDEARDKADTVRASGHGLDSRAAITARTETTEENRQNATMQRQEYMEQLMYRAAQKKEQIDMVHTNNLMQKLEQDEARQKRNEFERVRIETISEQKRTEEMIMMMKKEKQQAEIAKMHNKVKDAFESSAFYKKSKMLANISRSGNTKGARV